ncbi:hypothetical protein [Tabrizicola sp.]|nr:hypothetical protein [Tabrizicola sp.]
MSDQEIRFRLAEAVAKTTTSAAEARGIVEALYRFVTEAKA